jgi:hypothetical protein
MLEDKIFTSYNLIGNYSGPKEIYHGVENFITVSIVISLLIYAIVNVLYSRRLKQILKSFANHRFINQLIRDGNLIRETISLLLYVNYIITVTILLYYFSEVKTNTEPEIITPTSYESIPFITFKHGLGLFIEIFICVIVFYFLKLSLIRITGKIFKSKKETNEYILLLFIFNQTTGIILLPILIIIIYLKIYFLIDLVFIISGLILFYRLIRVLFYRISPSKFSVLYLFLYLCTVEILPLLILLKLIYRQLG